MSSSYRGRQCSRSSAASHAPPPPSPKSLISCFLLIFFSSFNGKLFLTYAYNPLHHPLPPNILLILVHARGEAGYRLKRACLIDYDQLQSVFESFSLSFSAHFPSRSKTRCCKKARKSYSPILSRSTCCRCFRRELEKRCVRDAGKKRGETDSVTESGRSQTSLSASFRDDVSLESPITASAVP